MLLATTAIAVTVYSLLYASPWLGSVYYTAAAAAIVLAVAACIQLQGERRAFWLGFALVAGAYMWFTVEPSPSQLTSNSLLRAQLGVAGADDPQLITTKLLHICFEHYCLSEKWTADSAYIRNRYRAPGGNVVNLAMVQRFPQLEPNRVAFVTTGNASLTLMFGWLGGIASRRMYQSRSVD
jgi:hypothetical protein